MVGSNNKTKARKTANKGEGWFQDSSNKTKSKKNCKGTQNENKKTA